MPLSNYCQAIAKKMQRAKSQDNNRVDQRASKRAGIVSEAASAAKASKSRPSLEMIRSKAGQKQSTIIQVKNPPVVISQMPDHRTTRSVDENVYDKPNCGEIPSPLKKTTSSRTIASASDPSMVLVSQTALSELTNQIALSLNRMRRIEEQVSVIPDLQRRLNNIIGTDGDQQRSLPVSLDKPAGPTIMGGSSHNTTHSTRAMAKPSSKLLGEAAKPQASERGSHGRRMATCARTGSLNAIASRQTPCSEWLRVQQVESTRKPSLNSLNSSARESRFRRTSSTRIEYDDIINDLLSLSYSVNDYPNSSPKGSGQRSKSPTREAGVATPQAEIQTSAKYSSPKDSSDFRDRLLRDCLMQNCSRQYFEKSCSIRGSQSPIYANTPVETLTREPPKDCPSKIGGSQASPLFGDDSRPKTQPDRNRIVAVRQAHSTTPTTVSSCHIVYAPPRKNPPAFPFAPTPVPSSSSMKRPARVDASTNTDLSMGDIITRDELNRLIKSLQLTPEQSAECLSVCGTTKAGSLPGTNKSNSTSSESAVHSLGNLKSLSTNTDESSSSSSSDEDGEEKGADSECDSTSGDESFSICSTYEDVSDFEVYLACGNKFRMCNQTAPNKSPNFIGIGPKPT